MPKLRKFKNSPYWYAEGLDAEGRRWSQSTKQRDRGAALRVGRSIELARALPGVRPLALSQALTALAEHKELKRVSAAELEIVATKGARLLEQFGPGRDCNTFSPKCVEWYIAARRADVADSTIRKELGKLFEALRLARRDGLYVGDPAMLRSVASDVLEDDEPGDRWLDDPEYLVLLPEVPAQRVDHVLVHCHTGARYGELYRIEAAHIDHAGRRLWLLGTKGKREHRERWVPLSDEAYDVLCARAELHMAAGRLFPDRWLKPNMRLTLARACRRAGIEPVTANDLRRTFCSWCARRGVSERECQRFMGHSPASLLVRRVYAQLAPEAGREAVQAFPRVSQTLSQTSGAIGGLQGDVRTSNRQKAGDPNEIRTRVTGVRGRALGLKLLKSRKKQAG